MDIGAYGCTALARSVEATGDSGRDDWAMARLLISAGANPSLYDRDGLSPAESANSNGNDDAVLAMLAAGMDPNSRGVAGSLIWYMSDDSPDVVRNLLARGAKPNAPTYLKLISPAQTPLQRAAESFEMEDIDEKTFFEIAQLWIRAGADASQLDSMPGNPRSFLLSCKEKEAFGNLPPGVDEDPGDRRRRI